MLLLKRFVLTSLSLLILSVGFAPLLSGRAYAADPLGDSKNQACAGAGLGTGNPCTTANGPGRLHTLLVDIVNILSAIIGAIAVIMIIIGGFRFVVSGGDASAVSSARGTIIYAIVGVVIVVLAQSLVHFVLFKVH